MAATICEILRRTEQGVTQPFICRSNSGQIFVVKGVPGCGRSALRAEWIDGRCGQELGLPIPYFTVVSVPEKLIEDSTIPGLRELGSGVCFGSLFQEDAQEITWLQSRAITPLLRARILLFDWLILNNDRILTPLGGNPNLICSGDVATLAVIDHQAAFDEEFDPYRLWPAHVFYASQAQWDYPFIVEESKKISQMIARFDEFWAELPEEWCEDQERTSPASEKEYERLRRTLMRPQTDPDTFWKISP